MFDTRQTALSCRRVAAWLATLLAAALTCALLASSASAATYSVYSCTGPGGVTLPNYAWVPSRSVPGHTSAFTFGSACPDYSVVATPGTTLAAGEDAGHAFTAPPGTSIHGYVVKRSINVTFPSSGTRPTLSAGLRRTIGGTETYAGECAAVATNCSASGPDTQSQGMSASALQLGVECAQSSTSCAGAGISTLRTSLISSRVDLTDNYAPAVTVTGGTLAGANATSGVYTLDVSINDIGGGVKSYWLSIDGVNKAVVNAGGSCGQIYTHPVPCPGERSASYSVDLASYAPGTHTAVVTATDAAGNAGTLAPVSFTVPGGVLASRSPAVEVPTLKTMKSVISVKSSKRVTVRGVLLTSSGSGIGGATIEVNATSIGGASTPATVIGSVTTSEDGSFAYKVRPNGALRITFVFRPASGPEGTATASTILRQSIALSARRSKARLRRGASLMISGRLSGAGQAAAGAPVEIQVKNGKRWSTIATVTATRSGSYKWKHRFTRVTRPTLFRFRAIVRSKQSWPWPSKTSRTVPVLVLG